MAEPILDRDKLSKLTARKNAFIRNTDALADNLMANKITLGMYEEDFRTRLRMYLAGSTMIAKGDPTKVTQSDWGKTGAELKKQYNWLHGFVEDIYENRDSVTAEAIKARAHLYAEAGNKMATNIQAGGIPLQWLPGDGSTECLNRCRCTWELTVLDIDEDEQLIQAIWTLHPAEHCDTCVSRDGYTDVLSVPVGVEVPQTIGLGGSA